MTPFHCCSNFPFYLHAIPDTLAIMNFYCAEVAWMKCMDGKRLPLEIAFASVYDPDIVYIVEIRLPLNLQMSLRDMAETKSYAGNKDRYANHLLLTKERKLAPTRIVKLDINGWLPALHKTVNNLLGENFILGVRCPSQMDFFQNVCGFQSRVRPVKIIMNGEAWGTKHAHGKLVRYKCPTTEARTMAVHIKVFGME